VIEPSGTWPNVPMTSGWPEWPMNRMCRSSAISRSAWRWTFETSGQVASTKARPRSRASSGTDLGTPWAEKTTGRSSGTSSSSSTNTAPIRLQAVDDEAVVDDLVADIDGRPEPLERQLDDLDRAIDSGAEAARRGDQDMKGWAGSSHRGGDVSVRLQQ
jgi:hypothetical protein